MEEESTVDPEPEPTAAEGSDTPAEISEAGELSVVSEITVKDSPEDENLETEDAGTEVTSADTTDVGEMEGEVEAQEGEETLDEETLDKEKLDEEKPGDLEEVTEGEQVETEEIVEEGEATEESEVKDASEDAKAPPAETQIKESQEVPDEEKHEHKTAPLEKKDSIDYELAPRFGDELDEGPRTSGDFLVVGEGVVAAVKFYKYMEEGEEEEEQDEIEYEVEEQYTTIDRAPYYEKHILLTKAIDEEKIENNILQKKLAMFFKRRRMEHVLKETDQKVDTQQKYGKKLDAYAELMEIDSRQRKTVSDELLQLKESRETKYYQLQNLFEKLQQREKEVGTGLINFNTGNPIPDKVVERLIRLQKSEMEKVSGMRLKYIKLKYLLAEKQEAITIIDKIGEDLYLMDFEQLKVENRGLADKIEERDEELTKLRSKCQNTIQILAHIREKIAALESDIDDLKEDLTIVITQSTQVREQLNTLKQQRDYFRNMSNKLRSDSGLLTEVELLRDMEYSMGDLQRLTEALEIMKTENKIKAQQIRNIRRNIEFATEGMVKKPFKNTLEKSVAHPHYYKGRPSIFTPTLPKDVFKHLKYFKPKSSHGKHKKKKTTIE